MSEDLVVPSDELAQPSATLFGTDDPAAAVQAMTKVARVLEDVVRKQNLVVQIGQGEHVRVEGWTFLGSLLGVFPVVIWTRPVMRDDTQVGWEARVEARPRSGEVVGAAEAECLSDERTWKGRDDFARKSMAQTRAVSKAMRGPLGFVMQLGGFNPTPAEEMPAIDMADPDIPFGDHPHEQLLPREVKPATEAQKKKLNVLIGRLRDGTNLTTEHLYRAVGRDQVLSEDGVLHFGPLRDSLTRAEASELIDRLEKYEAGASA